MKKAVLAENPRYLTNMQVDAIVNAASRLPRVNAGVDSAIHKIDEDVLYGTAYVQNY